MTDYTPTTEEVRDGWAYGNQEVDYDGNPVITLNEASAQFDRWLAAHERKISAEALREAAGALGDVRSGDLWRIAGDSVDPLDANTGEDMGVMLSSAWLRARADRIEQGGES